MFQGWGAILFLRNQALSELESGGGGGGGCRGGGGRSIPHGVWI